MKFAIRDLCWLTALAALACAEIANQIRTEQRCRQCERLVHNVDQDMHEHLWDFGASDRKMRDKIETHDIWWQQMQGIIPDAWKRLDRLERRSLVGNWKEETE